MSQFITLEENNTLTKLLLDQKPLLFMKETDNMMYNRTVRKEKNNTVFLSWNAFWRLFELGKPTDWLSFHILSNIVVSQSPGASYRFLQSKDTGTHRQSMHGTDTLPCCADKMSLLNQLRFTWRKRTSFRNKEEGEQEISVRQIKPQSDGGTWARLKMGEGKSNLQVVIPV